MKNQAYKNHNFSLKGLLILPVLLFAMAFSAKSQDLFPGDTSIYFENSTFSKVYYFEVEPTHKEITQTISAKISSGNLTIKITNPAEFRTCGFTLKSTNGARGRTEEVHCDPPKGKWKVKIDAKNVTGKASVKVKLQER